MTQRNSLLCQVSVSHSTSHMKLPDFSGKLNVVALRYILRVNDTKYVYKHLPTSLRCI